MSAALLIASKWVTLKASFTGTIVSFFARHLIPRQVDPQVRACDLYPVKGLLHDAHCFTTGIESPPFKVGYKELLDVLCIRQQKAVLVEEYGSKYFSGEGNQQLTTVRKEETKRRKRSHKTIEGTDMVVSVFSSFYALFYRFSSKKSIRCASLSSTFVIYFQLRQVNHRLEG
ncbi:hypothetical protein LOY55_06595 [Pseudomonas sp. B21-040]|uniref:hypothetical protein n=1 Tax=Pseudomonas sp. B21-040 TaxID=2895486 RepID=UPI00215F18D2|nr:hypothetical protein [Pseudomonas sp. B21-040]UVL41769.1 hypothetical protein LOY55_06595 [Pseudomonas sp. B21-040]